MTSHVHLQQTFSEPFNQVCASRLLQSCVTLGACVQRPQGVQALAVLL